MHVFDIHSMNTTMSIMFQPRLGVIQTNKKRRTTFNISYRVTVY